LFLGSQWSIILGYRRFSVKSLLVCEPSETNQEWRDRPLTPKIESQDIIIDSSTEGYDYYLSPSIFSSFVYINFSKDESENRRGNNLLYPSVSSHLCLGFGYIIKHSVQIPDDESRHRSPRAKKCYPTSGRAVNPKSWLVNMHILCTPWLIK